MVAINNGKHGTTVDFLMNIVACCNSDTLDHCANGAHRAELQRQPFDDIEVGGLTVAPVGISAMDR